MEKFGVYYSHLPPSSNMCHSEKYWAAPCLSLRQEPVVARVGRLQVVILSKGFLKTLFFLPEILGIEN